MSKKWSDSQQGYIDSMRRKNSGRRWTTSVIQKALDIAWDMWEQRYGINNNTMHSRLAANTEEIRAQLRELYGCGSHSLLPIDRHLFSKPEATLLTGEPNLMQQWIILSLTATQRAAVTAEDLDRTMTSERALMRPWLD
jgi:hypothetical protein